MRHEAVRLFLFVIPLWVSARNCGNITFDPNVDYSTCTSATSLQIVNTTATNFSSLANLTTVNGGGWNDFISVIRIVNNDYLRWTENDINIFIALKNLKTVKAVNINSNWITILNNKKMCVPKKDVKRLTVLTGNRARIQRCACTPGDFKNQTKGCQTFYGDVVINDVVERSSWFKPELYEKIISIDGTLIIENTTLLESVLFFRKLKLLDVSAEGKAAISIRNNSNLRMIYAPVLQKINNRGDRRVDVYDNPLLKIAKDARAQIYTRLTDNRQNVKIKSAVCTFTSAETNDLQKWKDCEVVYGNLVIVGGSYTKRMLDNLFSDLRVIHGCVNLTQTSFETLSCLRSLEKINCTKGPAITLQQTNLKSFEFAVTSIHSGGGIDVLITSSTNLCYESVELMQTLLQDQNYNISIMIDEKNFCSTNHIEGGESHKLWLIAISIGIYVIGLIPILRYT